MQTLHLLMNPALKSHVLELVEVYISLGESIFDAFLPFLDTILHPELSIDFNLGSLLSIDKYLKKILFMTEKSVLYAVLNTRFFSRDTNSFSTDFEFLIG